MKTLRLLLLVLLVTSAYGATNRAKQSYLFVNGPFTVDTTFIEVAEMGVTAGPQFVQITIQTAGVSPYQGDVACTVLKSNNVTVIPAVLAWPNIPGVGNTAEIVMQGKGNFGPNDVLQLWCQTDQYPVVISQISISALEVTP